MLHALQAPLCWAVLDHRAGNVVQAVCLTEALGLEPRLTPIRNRLPWL